MSFCTLCSKESCDDCSIASPGWKEYVSARPLEVLTFWPDCPVCNYRLSLRNMPGAGETYWHCENCWYQWDTMELIQALNGDKTVMEGG